MRKIPGIQIFLRFCPALSTIPRYALLMSESDLISSPDQRTRVPARPSTRTRRCHLGACLFAAALGLGGCSSYTAPTLEVLDARVVERTEEGAIVQFVVKATNQNNNPLPLRDTRYTLELNGEQVFSGIRSPEATLRRQGEQQVVLPAAVPNSMLGSLADGTARYRLSGSLMYVTPGAFAELLFDTGVRRPSVGFSDEGTLSMSVMPPAPEPVKP